MDQEVQIAFAEIFSQANFLQFAGTFLEQTELKIVYGYESKGVWNRLDRVRFQRKGETESSKRRIIIWSSSLFVCSPFQ